MHVCMRAPQMYSPDVFPLLPDALSVVDPMKLLGVDGWLRNPSQVWRLWKNNGVGERRQSRWTSILRAVVGEESDGEFAAVFNPECGQGITIKRKLWNGGRTGKRSGIRACMPPVCLLQVFPLLVYFLSSIALNRQIELLTTAIRYNFRTFDGMLCFLAISTVRA
ncbi:hypothetical protein AB1N83_009006 [Pleurotus pulmonarius]